MNKIHRFESLRKIVICFAAGCCLLTLAGIALADQFEWISKEEALKAVKILRKQKEIKHFCAPCDDKSIDTEEIKTVEIEPLKDNYWQVMVNGKGIDLAYVYFKTKKGKWKNLAVELDLDPQDVPAFLRDDGAGTE